MLNPNPDIKVALIGEGQYCYVVDDALENPEAWVQFSVDNINGFSKPQRNAYPGLEMLMPQHISASLDAFFGHFIRPHFHSSKTLQMYSRLSMITTPAEALAPSQWFCHRDVTNTPPDQLRAASVLYLFKDESLGGTSFYAPVRTRQETEIMFQDSIAMPADAFAGKHGIAPGYPTGSNPYFEKILTIPPKWNRLIFYDGGLFHSSDTKGPPAMSGDPRQGRLTLNGFFACDRLP